MACRTPGKSLYRLLAAACSNHDIGMIAESAGCIQQQSSGIEQACWIIAYLIPPVNNYPEHTDTPAGFSLPPVILANASSPVNSDSTRVEISSRRMR
jgi:hypothetical protein